MGLNLLFSSGTSSDCTPSTKTAPNPNPYRYVIDYRVNVGKVGAVVIARYPDCPTYEGKKVMVYHREHLDRALSHKKLDPHFFENSDISPFARFEPTALGLALAVLVAERLT